jgi:hypothetical protein
VRRVTASNRIVNAVVSDALANFGAWPCVSVRFIMEAHGTAFVKHLLKRRVEWLRKRRQAGHFLLILCRRKRTGRQQAQ